MVWVSDWGWKVWGLDWIGWIRWIGWIGWTGETFQGFFQQQTKVQAAGKRFKRGRMEDSTSLWVFGYGSLVWKPGFKHGKTLVGSVRGFARRWTCMQTKFYNLALFLPLSLFIFWPQNVHFHIFLMYLIPFWTLRCDTLFYSYLKTPGCGKAMKRIEALLANLAGWQH